MTYDDAKDIFDNANRVYQHGKAGDLNWYLALQVAEMVADQSFKDLARMMLNGCRSIEQNAEDEFNNWLEDVTDEHGWDEDRDHEEVREYVVEIARSFYLDGDSSK